VAATTLDNTELVDPLVPMLAEVRDGLYGQEESGNPHPVLFVVLAYADFVEIVARFGRYDYVAITVDRHADVYTLGRRLTELLDRRTQETVSQVHADETVPT